MVPTFNLVIYDVFKIIVGVGTFYCFWKMVTEAVVNKFFDFRYFCLTLAGTLIMWRV